MLTSYENSTQIMDPCAMFEFVVNGTFLIPNLDDSENIANNLNYSTSPMHFFTQSDQGNDNPDYDTDHSSFVEESAPNTPNSMSSFASFVTQDFSSQNQTSEDKSSDNESNIAGEYSEDESSDDESVYHLNIAGEYSELTPNSSSEDESVLLQIPNDDPSSQNSQHPTQDSACMVPSQDSAVGGYRF